MSIWRRARSFFPVCEGGVYLDHAGAAPLSSRVDEAVREFVHAAMRRGGPDFDAQLARHTERVRARVAALLSARPQEIAFVGDADRGLDGIAEGLAWRRGDAVVVAGGVGARAWRRLSAKGVETLPVPLVRGAPSRVHLEAALRHPRARLLALAAVDAASGQRADLGGTGALCAERGVLFCVDASQHLGCLALDPAACRIDFLVADAHRFLLGPSGIGLLYRGPRSAPDAGPAAGAYESGPENQLGIAALGAAVDLIIELDPEKIEQRVLALCDRLARGLEARGFETARRAETASGIVTFRVPGEAGTRTAERLLARRIFVASSAEGVRVSPHCYNDETEIDALLDAL